MDIMDKATTDLLNEIKESAHVLWMGSKRRFTPMRNLVFVMELSKETTTSGNIILIDDERKRQNKPLHEGIVLATWQPYVKEFKYTGTSAGYMTREVMYSSDLEAGDHVLYPGHAGRPVSGFNADRFRLVQEVASPGINDGIVGKLEYGGIETDAHGVLAQIIESFRNDRYAITSAALATRIQDQFVMVNKDLKSMTLSGS